MARRGETWHGVGSRVSGRWRLLRAGDPPPPRARGGAQAAGSSQVRASPSACRSHGDGLHAAVHVHDGNGMPAGFELAGKFCHRRAAFELGRCRRLGAEVTRMDRLAGVEVPVQEPNQCLAYIGDDRRPARRAQHRGELAPLVEDEHGRHRAARPLARLDAIGDRRAVAPRRREREIGELVVEQESAHHDVAAERALDGRGHRHRVAPAVDDGHVRRAGRPACRPSAARARRAAPGRAARRRARPSTARRR